jgi:hypothetical protein
VVQPNTRSSGPTIEQERAHGEAARCCGTPGEAHVRPFAGRSQHGFIYVPYLTALLGRGGSARFVPCGAFAPGVVMSLYRPTARQRRQLLEAKQVEDAAPLRNDRQRSTVTVTVGNTHLPAFVSDGLIYIQAPLRLVFEALGESLPEFVSNLEIRISDSRGRPLPFDCDGNTVYRPGLAFTSMVLGGGKS